MKKHKSRKTTPWEGTIGLTPTQKFLKHHYDLYYADRHRKLESSCEADMINSFTPVKCPFCEAKKI